MYTYKLYPQDVLNIKVEIYVHSVTPGVGSDVNALLYFHAI